jgi:hypothetical protein
MGRMLKENIILTLEGLFPWGFTAAVRSFLSGL